MEMGNEGVGGGRWKVGEEGREMGEKWWKVEDEGDINVGWRLETRGGRWEKGGGRWERVPPPPPLHQKTCPPRLFPLNCHYGSI